MTQNNREKPALPPLPPMSCACASLRRAARAVSQLYDREMRETGLRAPQFTLLQVLSGFHRIMQGYLGDLLVLDSTTLSRTLRTLETRKWIRSSRGEDQRERYWAITAKGRGKLAHALPLWDRAQRRLRKRLSEKEWATLLEITGEVAGAARRA